MEPEGLSGNAEGDQLAANGCGEVQLAPLGTARHGVSGEAEDPAHRGTVGIANMEIACIEEQAQRLGSLGVDTKLDCPDRFGIFAQKPVLNKSFSAYFSQVFLYETTG